MKKIISFPHVGDYYYPFSKLLTLLTEQEVIIPPPITKKTLELGTKYAPDTVCIPFKYNLGNFIESLNEGANILFTAGGGCRYRYYAEVTETILKDLGYQFTFYKLIKKENLHWPEIYKIFKDINPKLTLFKFFHDFLYAILFIFYMDQIDKIIRKNIGFETKKGSFEKAKKKMLHNFSNTNSIIKLTSLYKKYKRKFKRIKIDKPKNCLKVGIIGELYTSMEPYSNYELEKELAKEHIEIKRFTNLSYLMWQKRFIKKHMKRKVKKYCKYTLGADGLDNIYRALYLSKKNYDGIIHIKPFGCTPEITAIPIIQRVCEDYNMPIIFFSYDAESGTEGINTRLEAFKDLITIRRNKNE
ncbi:MAG TPA: hypothetical protein IAB35_01165 [Candidatus Faecimonas gallistercoris]|nr:hypothetical protein [Candidatus Faecimonas gallistercoris]